MRLNEYLLETMGVNFEGKYNKLACEEILAHKEKYPLNYEMIEWQTKFDKNGKPLSTKSDYPFFDYDDPDLSMGFEETMELYRVFANAFWKDFSDNKMELSSVSIALDYLKEPDLSLLAETYRDVFVARKEITIWPCETFFQERYPDYYEQKGYTNSIMNAEALSALSRSFYESNIFDDFIQDSLSMDEGRLKKHTLHTPEEEEEELEGYPILSYSISVGMNHLIFYTTQRGFAPIDCSFKDWIYDTMGEEERRTRLSGELLRFEY